MWKSGPILDINFAVDTNIYLYYISFLPLVTLWSNHCLITATWSNKMLIANPLSTLTLSKHVHKLQQDGGKHIFVAKFRAAKSEV